MNKIKKIILVLLTVGLTMIFLGLIMIAIDMLTDHFCYTTPINRIDDIKKCEKYWK